MITYTVTGEGPILAKLARRSSPLLTATLNKGKRAAATTLVPFIRGEAPSRTGQLRSSVAVRGFSVGPRIWYRHFVIGGTKRGVRPNPFVARGGRRGKSAASAAFEATVKREIR